MKTIKLIELLGTPCLLASHKGDQLASEIKHSVGFLTSVQVDFAGYEFFSSAFLNHAFGQICIDQDWDVKTFHRKVIVKALDEDDQDDLALALDNAQIRRRLRKEGINPEEFFWKVPV